MGRPVPAVCRIDIKGQQHADNPTAFLAFAAGTDTIPLFVGRMAGSLMLLQLLFIEYWTATFLLYQGQHCLWTGLEFCLKARGIFCMGGYFKSNNSTFGESFATLGLYPDFPSEGVGWFFFVFSYCVFPAGFRSCGLRKIQASNWTDIDRFALHRRKRNLWKDVCSEPYDSVKLSEVIGQWKRHWLRG